MPNAPVVKVVVTHRAAARAKYGMAGWSKIRRAITALARADKTRGLTTRFYALDSAADARKVHAQAVRSVTDVTAIKAAIDQVQAAWSPAYLVLLGGPDLLPTVNLVNPLWTGNPDDDPDQVIPSDLPYACDGPLSFSPSDYRGPTRVVGRIPDLPGASDPGFLVDQLSIAARGESRHRSSPQPVLAVSAKVWQKSTQLSVNGLPDVSGAARTSPAEGPNWTAADTAPAVHFVNCHGSDFDPSWYGQASPSNWNLPVAVAASALPGRVSKGAVVVAECCYGISHWPPSAAHGQASVAMTYLGQGAAAVFGASTVAYGPATTNDYADVLCRLFLTAVLGGASTGRALLVARQQFVQGQSFLDPTDLKTLAQFNLLGDPAAVPFIANGVGAPAAAKRRPVATPPTSGEVLMRRAQLETTGAALSRSTFACGDEPQRRSGLSTAALATLLGRSVPAGSTVRSFPASRNATAPRRAASRSEDALPNQDALRSEDARPGVAPLAHVAYLARPGTRPPSLVIVRDFGGNQTDVRVVERR